MSVKAVLHALCIIQSSRPLWLHNCEDWEEYDAQGKRGRRINTLNAILITPWFMSPWFCNSSGPSDRRKHLECPEVEEPHSCFLPYRTWSGKRERGKEFTVTEREEGEEEVCVLTWVSSEIDGSGEKQITCETKLRMFMFFKERDRQAGRQSVKETEREREGEGGRERKKMFPGFKWMWLLLRY